MVNYNGPQNSIRQEHTCMRGFQKHRNRQEQVPKAWIRGYKQHLRPVKSRVSKRKAESEGKEMNRDTVPVYNGICRSLNILNSVQVIACGDRDEPPLKA